MGVSRISSPSHRDQLLMSYLSCVTCRVNQCDCIPVAQQGTSDQEELLALLKPCPDQALKIWPVDKALGNFKNNGPQLLRAIETELPLL